MKHTTRDIGFASGYGWDEAGNYLWCGEAGRCHCDHSRLVLGAATLLKAAPELLEACNAALNDWHAKPSNINKKEPKYLAILRAAIAKAEYGV